LKFHGDSQVQKSAPRLTITLALSIEKRAMLFFRTMIHSPEHATVRNSIILNMFRARIFCRNSAIACFVVGELIVLVRRTSGDPPSAPAASMINLSIAANVLTS
jgi:hypothetical protein